MIVHIPMKDQRVLIVGGGAVARRKALALHKEGARITILAKQISAPLQALAFSMIWKAYESKDLQGFDLIIAATDDEQCNQSIVEDATQAKILALNVHHQDQQVKTLLSFEEPLVQIAVSTKGHYPAMNRHMLTRFQEVWEAEFQEKLHVLHLLRPLILALHPKDTVHEFLTSLCTHPIEELRFLLAACQQRKAHLYAFHGAKRQSCIEEEIMPFLKNQDHSEVHWFCYLSKAVLASVNAKQHQVYSLQELIALLQNLQIEVTVCAMVLQMGSYYHQVQALCKTYQIPMTSCALQSTEDIQALITYLEHHYAKEGQTLLLLYHASERGLFEQARPFLKVKPTTLLCHNAQLTQLDPTNMTTQVLVYPLHMLSGYHRSVDVALIQTHLKNHVITCVGRSYLQELTFIKKETDRKVPK